MTNYKIGKVYKIIHTQSDIVYVGSTFNRLSDRFRQHRYNFECTITKYIKQYGYKNFKIILIKEYEVVDRKHLESKEQIWINLLKPINKNSAFTIEKLKDKQYRNNNKDKIKESSKKHYENNKDEIIKKQQEYQEKNKDKISKRFKEKIKCEICNCFITKYNKSRHEQTKKHLNALIH